MRANFRIPEMFKYKFGRDPRNWTIDQLHNLYIRSNERTNKRRKEYSNYIDSIIKEIPKNDNGYHIVYFSNKGRDFQYEISYNTSYKSWAIRTESLELKSREDRLFFLLHSSNIKTFEMGQKLFDLGKLRSNLHYIVKEVMWELVEKELKDRFKGKSIRDEIFIIDISGKKYFVEIDENSYGNYYKFNMKNEFVDEIILV